MSRTRLIAACVVMTAVLIAAFPTKVESDGKRHRAKTAAPPVGRGPSAPAGIAVAPLATIEQRGHVNNMCEAQTALAAEVSQHGGQQVFGDYRVAYMVDPPHGWYEMNNGSLAWRPPAPAETCHLEAVVMDSLSNQPIPMGGLTMDVVDASGNVAQSQPLVFYWHPMISHYANNFTVPTGTYTLRVRGPAPEWRRHDIKNGDRFTQPLDASFTGVKITARQPEPADLGNPPAGVPSVSPAGSGPTPPPSGKTNLPSEQTPENPPPAPGH